MKNKLFLSISLLVATNALVINSAHAYNWKNAARDAGRVVSGTVKIAGAAATIAAAALLPMIMYEQLIARGTSSVRFDGHIGTQFRVTSDKLLACGNNVGIHGVVNNTSEILPFIYIACGAATIGGFVIGSLAFDSALKDFKSIGS